MLHASSDESSQNKDKYLHQRWGGALREIYIAQEDVSAYVAFANETALTAADCHAIATMLSNRHEPEESLAWVERGIDLGKKTHDSSMAFYSLPRLKRELLMKLGRGGEALDAAWAEYLKHPSKDAYYDLMKFVPEAERPVWHVKAIEAAYDAGGQSLIELLVSTKEIARLAEFVRQCKDSALEGMSHYTTEPAAKCLEKTHSDLAARLWRAQGMRIINAKKSKYYTEALCNFERAMQCYEKSGLTDEWTKTVAKVRIEHHRKSGFLSGFEALVAGVGPSRKPSFMERAKARWSNTEGTDRKPAPN